MRLKSISGWTKLVAQIACEPSGDDMPRLDMIEHGGVVTGLVLTVLAVECSILAFPNLTLNFQIKV